MTSNLSKLINVYILLICFSNVSVSEDTRAGSGFSSSSAFLNYSNSIFNTPIEQYKYVKTHRGIEVYETYRHPTNGYVNQTIFPKTMPIAIIKTNQITKNVVIYKTYSNSIYNKPIEFGTFKNKPLQNKNNYIKNKTMDRLPTYDGGKEIQYGGESE